MEFRLNVDCKIIHHYHDVKNGLETDELNPSGEGFEDLNICGVRVTTKPSYLMQEKKTPW